MNPKRSDQIEQIIVDYINDTSPVLKVCGGQNQYKSQNRVATINFQVDVETHEVIIGFKGLYNKDHKTAFDIGIRDLAVLILSTVLSNELIPSSENEAVSPEARFGIYVWRGRETTDGYEYGLDIFF